jgi:hypothetical protein
MPSLRAAVLFSIAALCSAVLSAQVPSPEEFFGHVVGADYKLINYTDMVRYFRTVEAASDRIKLLDIGATSYGQRMTMAVISSPENLANIEKLRQISVQLAHPGDLDQAEAAKLVAQGKPVVWIDAGLHATESIAGQNIIELVWQMSSRRDAEVMRILDQVVLLVTPVNPDGLELVANAYMATVDPATGTGGSMSTPVLYQRYVGHDNNRDFYACNQLEAQNISRVFFRDWCPQIVYNHHQTAPRDTIIYTPPFRDPSNYLVDPLVVRGIEIVAAHMNNRFALEDKPGVISRSGAPYSGWWNGGLRSTGYFHNVIGILTESFGRPEPTPIKQPLTRRLPYHDYPQPISAQVWHARQTIEYLQTANFAILDYAARFGADLLHGMYRMSSRAIATGRKDHWTPTPRIIQEARRREDDSVFSDPDWRDPRAYVLSADQPNWSAVMRFARSLWHCGVDLHFASEAFPLNGKVMPSGSLVILCDQPYRAHVLDMMEPQWHPDDLRDGKPVPPYDAAGWTLAMQMDVEVERTFEALQGPFERIESLPTYPRRILPQANTHWQLDARDLHAITAVNRLLAAGCAVEYSANGHYVVASSPASSKILGEAARDLGVVAKVQELVVGEVRRKLAPVRIGLFDVFGGNMATGWDQWLLQQFEFPVQLVWGDRIEQGDLRRDFDVLIFHTGLPGPRDLRRAMRDRQPVQFAKLQSALPPFQDWSDIEARATKLTGDKSLPALRNFVAQGGTLMALGGEVEKVIRHFDLPIKVGTFVKTEDGESENGERATTRDEYYVPGSLMAIEVDTKHELARGASEDLAAMLYRSATILEVIDGAADVDVVARYRSHDTLVSGWAIGTEYLHGKAGVVAARVGRGRVLLYGIDATYRGQPLGTAKLFFQGILTASESR